MRLPNPLRLLAGRRPPRLDPAGFGPVPAGGFLVGGAVRDALLGRESSDLDWLVPNARAAARVFGAATGGSVFPLDEDRGHWRVVAPGREIDFIELHTRLEEDLAARDFTINALALDDDGRVIDPTGGLRDLHDRKVRMTSASALRADPLRLLRAVRFAARLGFEIEVGTRVEIRRLADMLERGDLAMPAPERVRDELDETISAQRPGSAFSELEGLGLMGVFLPELALARGVEQGGFHHLDVLDHSLEALERLATGFPEADVPLRWGTLLHDVGKPVTRERGEDGRIRFHGHDREGARIAGEAMRRLRRPAREAHRIAGLVRYHMLPLPRGVKDARRFVHRRRPLLPDLLKLMVADREAARGKLSSEATRRAYRTALSRVIAILAEEPAAPPLLDGREVMELLGLEPGPRVGEALRFLSEAQAVEDIAGREEAKQAVQRYARAQGWLD